MTQMGTHLLADIWPMLQMEGALSNIVYHSIARSAVTSTNITSTSIAQETVYSTTIEALIGSYKTMEVDGQFVQLGDLKARFPRSILSVTPQQHDEVVFDGSTYVVMPIVKPVDGATWELQLRRP